MLYTGNGDNGYSKLFGCEQEIGKDSEIFEILGIFDELNSFLGICKVKANNHKISKEQTFSEILEEIQQNLFIIQANLAGANKVFGLEKTIKTEEIINEIEKELPKIRSFCVSGGNELSTYLDFARTIARKAERGFVKIQTIKAVFNNENIAPFLNRLSSLLYALSRFANLKSGFKEINPTYK
ncbi:MAG: cob(I)yrinic acid a,c-diamide adenosyltransferase [bacterium]